MNNQLPLTDSELQAIELLNNIIEPLEIIYEVDIEYNQGKRYDIYF